MPPYRYRPLVNGRENIRLLELLPAEAEDAEIRIELVEYKLHRSQPSRHIYEALSYVWGHPTPVRTVFVGNDLFEVTPNLYAALVQLRDHTFPRILWIDAICINQADDDEKALQIQSMAMIYGMAKCVFVWLGDAAEGSDNAVEIIRAGASNSVNCPEDADTEKSIIFEDEDTSKYVTSLDEDSKKDVTLLLLREWFERIWVLQEVAAAEHIVIMCGRTEIAGHAFCLGLKKLNAIDVSQPWHSPATAVLPLIEDAGIRQKFNLRDSTNAGLNQYPLGELLDMYVAHKATHRHDKLYALLGMTSDDISTSGLLPDYHVPWNQLLQRIVHFVLGKEVRVESCTSEEMASIRGTGGILGMVSGVAWNADGNQVINIKCQLGLSQSRWRYRDHHSWTIETTAVSRVRVHDICYWLEGASSPMIIRPHGSAFHVIMMVVPIPSCSHGSIGLALSLIWDWSKAAQDSRGTLPDTFTKTTSYWTTALILKATTDGGEAETLLQRVLDKISGPTDEQGNEFPSGIGKITEIELVEIVECFPEDVVAQLITQAEPIIHLTERVACSVLERQPEELVTYMLNKRCGKMLATRAMLTAAAKNIHGLSPEAFTLLLDRREDTTNEPSESVLVAAVSSFTCRANSLEALLDHVRDTTAITEAVLVAAMRTESAAEKLQLLLTYSNDTLKITEAILMEILKQDILYDLATTCMPLLLSYGKDKLEVTEAVLTAALQKHRFLCSGEMIHDLFTLRLNDTISEAVLITAATNVFYGERNIRMLAHLKRTHKTPNYRSCPVEGLTTWRTGTAGTRNI